MRSSPRACATCCRIRRRCGNRRRADPRIPPRAPRSTRAFSDRHRSTCLLPSLTVRRAPVTPDEATQRHQVRLSLDLLTAAAVVTGVLVASQAVANHEWRTWATVIALGMFAALLQTWPRRILVGGRIESAVTVMALATAALIFTTTIISPAGALIAAMGLLIPIIAAVPYVEVKSLRRLLIVAWAASIATAAASLLPDPVPLAADATVTRLWGFGVVSGLVLFLLYQSTERLRAP